MPPLAAFSAEYLILPAAVMFLWASAAVWSATISRWRRRKAAIPYQSRRPVPWGFIEVALLLIAYFAAQSYFVPAARHWMDATPPDSTEIVEEIDLDARHPLARVLQESTNLSVVLMCVALAIVVTPIAEELVFRLLIQGWLEKLERRLRRRFRPLRRLVAGALPVGLVTAMFAALHSRSPMQAELSVLIAILAAISASNLTIIVLTTGWLKFISGATLADLGIVPDRLGDDVKLGLLAYLAATPPIYGVAYAADYLLPKNVVVDPIPLLLLAVALGALYYRTHRIVPSIVLHAAFNATAVVLGLLTLR